MVAVKRKNLHKVVSNIVVAMTIIKRKITIIRRFQYSDHNNQYTKFKAVHCKVLIIIIIIIKVSLI